MTITFPFNAYDNVSSIIQCGQILCDLVDTDCQKAYEQFVNMTGAWINNVTSNYSDWVDSVCLIAVHKDTGKVYANHLYPCLNTTLSNAIKLAFEISFDASSQCLHSNNSREEVIKNLFIALACFFVSSIGAVLCYKYCNKNKGMPTVNRLFTGDILLEDAPARSYQPPEIATSTPRI